MLFASGSAGFSTLRSGMMGILISGAAFSSSGCSSDSWYLRSSSTFFAASRSR